MASESDDSDLRARVAELEATVQNQQETIRKMLPGRRGALKAGGLLAGGGLLGALGSDQAAAADGTQDTSAGTIGAAGDSNDIYLDQLYDPDGDEILNVDDTGAINAQGREWLFDSVNTKDHTINQSYTDPTGYQQARKLVGAKPIPTPTAYFSGPAHGEAGNAFIGATLAPDGRVVFAPSASSNVGITSQLLDFAVANGGNK